MSSLPSLLDDVDAIIELPRGPAAAADSAAFSGVAPTEIPLVVDLDGTLIHSDLLVESFLALAASRPLRAASALLSLRSGKGALKARLADELRLDIGGIPLNEAVVARIRAEKAAGRQIYLASASDIRLVEAMSARVGLFDGVLGSSGGVNLSGRAKADALCRRFGERRFDYIGGSSVDLHVWSRCRKALMAGGTDRLFRKLKMLSPDAVSLDAGTTPWRDYLRALRPHQWLKNILVFAPALAAHAGWPTLMLCVLAFWSFSFCASAVYVLNDLLDLRSDRAHPRKCRRPFASGRVPLVHGAAMIPALLTASVLLAAALPPEFLLVLGGYFMLTTVYSLYLKRKMVADVVALAVLYACRLVGGAAAVGLTLSHWLQALSIFLFLCLALVKRCAELVDRVQAGKGDPAGRGYKLDDLPSLESMAAASGYLTALVMALYLNSDAVSALYRHPERMWLICLALLFWVSRMILKTRRGEMDDDPIVFALKDRVSLVTGVACAVIIAASI